MTVASQAQPGAAFEMSACLAIASINSDLFTNVPFRCGVDWAVTGSSLRAEAAARVFANRRTCFIAIAKTPCQAARATALLLFAVTALTATFAPRRRTELEPRRRSAVSLLVLDDGSRLLDRCRRHSRRFGDRDVHQRLGLA